ncbi:MAG: DUF4124 domain-containing protein [Pseudomonadota bacterium]
MRVTVAFSLLLLVAAPLGAQTYKWVDERGVVNYSNAPPPGANAAKATPVEDRVSIIPNDPYFLKLVAAMQERALRLAEYEEREFLQRQRLLAARAYAPAPAPVAYEPPPRIVYPAIYGPVFTSVVPRPVRVVRHHPHLKRHHAPSFRKHFPEKRR